MNNEGLQDLSMGVREGLTKNITVSYCLDVLYDILKSFFQGTWNISIHTHVCLADCQLDLCACLDVY